ncbi:acyltransferase family protein [Roseomonas sp. E05]|uniref:acyltransferase family protein n=1 Tax=Roseomonas sp. E05 TaxID=3046310 RepID=UPI0024BB4648|nr:acyltransferase family protein [Roseomonas sp. E05]MDJ0390304.1 acyltransferase family protein [Roseomonas sp. E05]
MDGLTIAPGTSSGTGALAAQQAASRRWDDLDQLRAILMLAGIPYHAGLVYASHATWIVASPDKSVLMTWLIQFSHTFRMPAFFLLAGVFAMLLVCRRGPGAWLEGRIRRIGIPLATSLVLVSPLMVMASAVSQGGFANALPALLAELRHPSDNWTVHLWFLIYLLPYCGLFAGLYALTGPARIERATAATQDALARHPLLGWVALLAMGLITLGAAAAAKLLDAAYLLGGIFIPAQFVAYGLMFLAGALLAARPVWLEGFRRPSWSAWALAFALAGTMAALQDNADDLSRAVTYFLMPVVGVLFSHVLLSAARRWLDRRTRFSRAMVDVAMTMYLVHVAFVLWLSVAFLAVPLPAEVEIVLIILLSTAGSYGFCRIVRASPLLTFLFNGTEPDAGRGMPAAGQGASPLAGRLNR